MIHHLVFGRKAIVKNEGLILDLPFQNSFVDATGKNTMIAGGSSNLPTFTLEGGEYAATFNGSQSLKTASNLLISSDKVSISFWIKTTQTTIGLVAELSESLNSSGNNGFWIINNNTGANKLEFLDRNNLVSSANNIVRPNPNINSGVWQHIVITSDRALNRANQSKVYVNGVLNFVTVQTNDINNNYGNHILFIGQRAGNSLGFNGQLKFLKIFNYPLSTTEITNLYNKTM